jgi:plasmid replication initiation protein
MNAIKLSKRRKEVLKHSSAVQITNSITLLQRRAWNILLAKAYDDFDTTDRYQIRVRELVEMLDYKSHDDSHLKEALEKLTTTAVKWNILGKDKSCEWGVFPLLSGAVIRQGVLTYAFSPLLKERLHNPRMYARISLSLQNKFQSKHALALYELCLDYFDLERNYGETPFIPITEFRELMGVGEEEYPTFARLNDKVIKRAVEEINELSDLVVNVKHQRSKRKVEELKFCVFRKTELTLPFASAEEPQASEFDVAFERLSAEQQQRIIQEAYSLLPDFVKQYDGSELGVADKVIKPLLLQKRNELLKRMMQSHHNHKET